MPNACATWKLRTALDVLLDVVVVEVVVVVVEVVVVVVEDAPEVLTK